MSKSKAPRTSRVVNTTKRSRSEAKSMAQQALLAHWHTIVAILENYLKIMKEKYVSSPNYNPFSI